VFKKDGAAWVGTVDGVELRFVGAAGDLYEHLLAMKPGLRVGFRSRDIGPAIASIYGPTLWMKTSEERFGAMVGEYFAGGRQ
jgi:hypothetical protein